MMAHSNLSVYYHNIVAMKISPEINWTVDEIENISPAEISALSKICLLYTSDAADE